MDAGGHSLTLKATTSVTFDGTLTNLANLTFIGTSLSGTGSAASTSGTGAITGLGSTTFNLTGSNAGKAGGITFSGFTSADTTTITGAAGFDDTARGSEGMTFANATNVAGTGTISNVVGSFADDTSRSAASGITYTGFSAVTGTGGTVTGITGNFDIGTKVSSASGLDYSGFNLGTVSGSGAGATITGTGQTYTLDATTADKGSSNGVMWTSFGNIGDTTGTVNFGASSSLSGNVTAQTLDYSGYGSAVSFDLSDGSGATTGIGGTWSGVGSVVGSANGDAVTGMGSTAFHMTGTKAGTAAAITFTGFTSADTTTITGAAGFDDTARSSEGMTFANATNVAGTGTISNVVGSFADDTSRSAASGITYTGFSAVTGTGGTVTGITGNFDIGTKVSSASGLDYSGFNLGTVSGSGASATVTGTSQTYTLTGVNAGSSNSITWTSFGNIADSTGTVNFGTAGNLTGNVTAQTLDYSGYGSAVTFDLSDGNGATTGIGGTWSGVGAVVGSSNSDTIEGTGKTYTLSGANAGSDGAVSWTSFENIVDATGTVAFGAGSSLSGNINARTLDYSGYTSAVSFDLSDGNGATTGVGGTWSGVTSVAGSSNSDTIKGSNQTYTLTGAGAGGNGTVNWTSFEQIADSGVGTLNGTGQTYTLTGSNAGTVALLPGGFSGIGNITDTMGTVNLDTGALTGSVTASVVNFDTNGTVGGNVTAKTLIYNYATPVSMNLSGGGSTGIGGNIAGISTIVSSSALNIAGVFDAGLGSLTLTSIAGALNISGSIDASTIELTAAGNTLVTGSVLSTGATTVSAGTLQIGDGGTSGSITGNVIDNTGLIFDRSDAVTYTGAISGAGNLVQAGAGKLTLDGNSSGFSGNTMLQTGSLIIGGTAGNGATLGGNVTVDAGAALGGHGTIVGNVDVLAGGIVAPGDSIGTLTVNGDFTAAQGSVLDYEFGAPAASPNAFTTSGAGDSVHVGGNLELDGATLKVTDAGGMGPGLYNLFTYGGTLTETNGGFALDNTTGQTLQVQSLTAQKQINLIDATGLTLDFWNANGQASSTQMGGGSGTWSVTSPEWTDATGSVPNLAMQPQPGFAIFGGTPGTVAVDDNTGSVTATGMQFAVDGYTLTGGTLTLVGSGGATPIIRVGDGSSTGSAMNATIGNVLTGSDGLAKTDAGTLVLSGANTFSGGLAIDGGTLEAAANGALGSGSATVDNSANQNATLKVDNGVSLGNQVLIANGGTLDNAGSIVRNGSSEYAVEASAGSATIINTGSLQSDSGVIFHDGGTVTNNGGNIAATAGTSTGLHVDGAGAMVTNENGGGISGGYIGVQMLGGSLVNTGSHSDIHGGGYGVFTNDGAASVTNSAGASIHGGSNDAVSMYQGGTVTNQGGASISGVVGVRMSGNGSVVNQTGASITGSFGVILAADGTVDNSASIVASDTGVALMGNDTLVNAAGASIRGGTASVSTAGGNGAVSLTNAGTLDGDVLLADGAANAVTLLAGSTLQGQLQIGSNAGSTLTLDGSGTQLYSQAVTGATTFTGTLAKLGGGSWILDTDLTPGGTTVGAGTLQLGNGGTSGSITGDVTDNGSLVFDRSDSVTFAGVVSGTGLLAQAGSGTLTLNGSSSAFAGTTIVSNGTLVVGDSSHAGASLGGMVAVVHDATLGGIGTLGGLDLAGTLAPGGSIGTLHVSGDATFEQGSTFNVEASPDGKADLLAVGGGVSIKGGSVIAIAQAGNWAPQTTYTIITAGQGVSGSFGSVSDNLAFLTPVLGYSANAVELTLERNNINFADVALTPNEKGVATGAGGLDFGNPLYDALVKLDAPTAQAAFDQLSGEYHASQQTARINDSRYVREAMNQRLQGDDDSEAAKLGDTQLTAWAHAWGHWGTVSSDANVGELSDNGDGLLIGADLPVGAQARIGVLGGASRNSLSIGSRASWGRITSQWLGAFAGIGQGAFALRGGLAYALDRVPANREVAFPGYSDRLSDHTSGDTLTGFVEGAWTLKLAQGSIAPFMNLARTRVETDATTEAGGAAALNVSEGSANVSFSTVGARGSWRIASHLDLHGELGWQHAFGDTTPERTLQFVAGGPGFVEYGAPVANNAGVGKVGVGWRSGRVAVDADYEGLFGGGVEDPTAKVSVSVVL